jgi:hypothetical protein
MRDHAKNVKKGFRLKKKIVCDVGRESLFYKNNLINFFSKHAYIQRDLHCSVDFG